MKAGTTSPEKCIYKENVAEHFTDHHSIIAANAGKRENIFCITWLTFYLTAWLYPPKQ